jgi:hypothetical protein
MKMNSENRCVKKAKLISWDDMVKSYAKLFLIKKGNISKALLLALGTLIIQTRDMGIPTKNTVVNKKQEYRDNCDSVEVERAFSHAKGKFGLGYIRARIRETAQSAIALSIPALNLSSIWRLLFHSLFSWLDSISFKKFAFVQ